jgi:hypothetical protein
MDNIFIKVSDQNVSKAIQEKCFENGLIWPISKGNVINMDYIHIDFNRRCLSTAGITASEVTLDEFLKAVENYKTIKQDPLLDLVDGIDFGCNDSKNKVKELIVELIKRIDKE